MNCNGARPKQPKIVQTADNVREERHLKKSYETQATTISDPFSIVSVRLYNFLDRVGASDEFRKLREECAISREIVLNFYHQHLSTGIMSRYLSSSFIFGSSSEGTTTPGLNSDTDILNCRNFYPVIDNISEVQHEKSLLMIRDTNTQPGYVKLQFVHDGQLVQSLSSYISYEHGLFEPDKKGRICLKPYSQVGRFPVTVHERNGPADTNTQDDYDYVTSYRCLKVPNFAREWIGRRRQFRWPQTRILDKMATMGCFLVGVGHPASDERHIEWRVSFSLQERELMFSMNIVQHKCYIVLKMIKKDLIEPIVGKSISSYHLKTCMFHVIEATNSRIWKRNNLGHCVLLCMYILLQWVSKGYCPNYFIKEENMFDRDINRLRKIKLVQRLRYLLTNCEFFLHIKLDRVGFYLTKGISHAQNEPVVLHAMFNVKIRLLVDILLCRTGICLTANTESYAIGCIYNIFNLVSETSRPSDHSEHQTKLALSLITPFMQIQLAQSYASLAFSVQSLDDKYRLLQRSGHYLRESGYRCSALSKLLQATVVYKLEHYEKCINILEHTELVLAHNPFSLCECDIHVLKYYKNRRAIEFEDLSVSSILEKTCPCMIFLRSDFPIVPEALKFEFYRSVNTQQGSRHYCFDQWFDLAVVDAIVYIHFLKYLAYSKLKRHLDKHVAIHKLESELKSQSKLGHRETGYNLLGWIHFHEGWMQRGINYFRLSWEIRPHHNAAKFHMLKYFGDVNSYK